LVATVPVVRSDKPTRPKRTFAATSSRQMLSRMLSALAIPKEVAMPVVAVFQSPSFTRERYEESVVKVSGGKSRVDSRADWPVEGLLAHIAGEGPDGFRVVDVWASEEAFQQFGETLIPILSELGVDGEPEVYPTHTFVSA